MNNRFQIILFRTIVRKDPNLDMCCHSEGAIFATEESERSFNRCFTAFSKTDLCHWR